MSRSVLTTWACRRPNCQARNVEERSHCAVCEAPRPSSFRSACRAAAIPPVDLEDFCRVNFDRTAKRHKAEVHILDGDVFLTLTPDHPTHFAPAIYRIEHNALTPCDSFGRPSW